MSHILKAERSKQKRPKGLCGNVSQLQKETFVITFTMFVNNYMPLIFCFDISESYDVQEAKNFFEQNYSQVYYIFYDVFISTEADLKQRGKYIMKSE